MRRLGSVVLLLLVGGLAYFAFWPVPVAPVAWEAPRDAGYTGPFATDSALATFDSIALGGHEGPESVARDAAGRLYVGMADGTILRIASDGTAPNVWANTGGRPLGLAFDSVGTLFVADAQRGLLAIDTAGAVRLLADSADGVQVEFADDVAVARSGRVYFTDASTKFGARSRTDADASMLDIVEHAGNGRLLEWDPASGRATTVLEGINFANGVAMAPDEDAVLLCEMGHYRILRVVVAGPERGRATPIIENLPGLPDNISRADDGRYWVALYAPRSALLDRLSGLPALRKAILRIPRALRPSAAVYSHVIAIDADGRVLDDRQDPQARFPTITDVLATDRHLYLGSLRGSILARVPR